MKQELIEQNEVCIQFLVLGILSFRTNDNVKPQKIHKCIIKSYQKNIFCIVFLKYIYLVKFQHYKTL